MKMKLLLCAAAIAALFCVCHCSVDDPLNFGFIEAPADSIHAQSFLQTPEPHTYIDTNTLPAHFDWRNVSGVNYVTPAINQHLPVYCGACWAFAPLSALSDRIKIQRKAAWPEVILSPQALLSCGSSKLGEGVSCSGGYPSATYSYVHRYGVPDMSCAPYQAKDLTCTPENICKSCGADGKCEAVPVSTSILHFVSEYGSTYGEDRMKAEIFTRGPIACEVAVTHDFLKRYRGGIFKDLSGDMQIRHVISLLGWGEHDGQPYWIGRNSWGTYWGEDGFFRIVRGYNNLNIESNCHFAVPATPAEAEERFKHQNEKHKPSE